MNKSNLRKRGRRLTLAAMSVALAAGVASCDKSESYSDLLRDEEKAVNWYLAQQRVEVSVPEDGKFEVGPDAPFYRMNDDGTVYMQVINAGDPDDRPKEGDKVFFRFMRRNTKAMYLGTQSGWFGNMDDLDNPLGNTYLFYGNETYPNSTQYGTGIQVPLDYLGYYSEVNLVLKSYSGFTGNTFQSEQSSCIPYIINVKYYKPEY